MSERDPEKTPVENLSPIEQIALDVGEIRRDVRDTKVTCQRTHDYVLEHHELLKDHGRRLTVLERERRLPHLAQIALVLVAIVAIACSFLR